ncbi:MAG TPA: hypothetical protein VMD28_08625 [Acidimicrobiales bacterium]|nr:hypothetical protein [Acidimicrobiales bacterium]
MWLAWSIPLMVVGVAIAVVPVLWGSLLDHRGERRESARGTRAERPEVVLTVGTVRVDCPLCDVSVYGSSNDELVDRAGRHAWRAHGIPSPAHVLESSLAS